MKCMPGDMAVIISDPDVRNVGCFVHVERPAFTNEFNGPNDWACRAISPLFGSLYPVDPGEICGIDDRDLQPIRGVEHAKSANEVCRVKVSDFITNVEVV